MPILSLTRLAVLVGLWPLWLRGKVDVWRSRAGRFRDAVSECLEHFGMLEERVEQLEQVERQAARSD
jgi:hypothetical protein